jgi:hypothetical protein
MKKISNILSHHKEQKIILMDGKNCDKKKYSETQLNYRYIFYKLLLSVPENLFQTGILLPIPKHFFIFTQHTSIFLKSVPVIF